MGPNHSPDAAPRATCDAWRSSTVLDMATVEECEQAFHELAAKLAGADNAKRLLQPLGQF
jgi:hypothetical protein